MTTGCARPRRSPALAECHARPILAHGPIALRQRLAGLRVPAPANQRPGFRPEANHCARWQRRQRPHHNASSGKGAKDRITMLPQAVINPLKRHLRRVHALHQRDMRNGLGSVYLPYALARKYPNADREWIWQWVFPSHSISRDPRSGIVRRHHVSRTTCLPHHTCTRHSPRLQARRYPQARDTAHPASFLRHPPACHGLRHPHRAGAARPQRRQDHHDLHPRSQPRRPGCAQSVGLKTVRDRLRKSSAASSNSSQMRVTYANLFHSVSGPEADDPLSVC